VELSDYLKIVRRRWVSIVVIAVLCTAAALAITLTRTKTYASSARLFVSTTTDDANSLNQGGQFSIARVQSYADLISSRELASTVIADLNLDVTVEELRTEVSAKVATNTVNLTITATDPDAHRAQQIAQSYATNMVDLVRQLETPPGQTVAPVKATVVDQASYNDVPVAPRPIRNTALGLILGMMLGLGIAVLRHVLDTRINSVEDLSEVIDKPVLGTIGLDADAKNTPLITAIPSHAPRAEAFRVLRTNLQFVDVDSAQKVFVLSSALPAEGKTSTSLNLALSMAQAGIRTLLIEADLRRPRAAIRLALDGAVGLTSVLVGKVSLEDALQRDAGPAEPCRAAPEQGDARPARQGPFRLRRRPDRRAAAAPGD